MEIYLIEDDEFIRKSLLGQNSDWKVHHFVLPKTRKGQSMPTGRQVSQINEQKNQCDLRDL